MPAPSTPLEAPALSSTRLLSFDPGAMRVAIQDSELEHVQLESGQFQGRVAHTVSEGLALDWGSYNLALMARGQLTRDRITLGVLLDGCGDWRVYGGSAANGDLLVQPEHSELMIRLPPGAQWLALQVSPERLEAAGVPLQRLRERGRWRLGEATALPRLMAGLSSVLSPEADASTNGPEQLAQAAEQALATLLCELVARTEAFEQERGCSAGERLRVVRRAEAWLAEHPEPMVRIDDLCRAACTSLSRLERSFNDVFGVGPRRYLAMRRLASVRQELLAGAGGESVTEVATRWGFFHLSRFAQEYGQLFGERPSETLRQARVPA
ncbi:helix-turn-helix domain-containing protein [Pelomonas sp. SE-A7]|uniref:helix-turn-helix domain-containing protein n=1 Tax=Pelomonas sp. SE-A7 TaxID=3054953 RepID=UPI00259CE904|nr:helix-turn-helix domain-containing protein [Pelomonas sp. SE-A7]MDM4765051.1 helix-turn-helix domain-containing protein [Pelomonas sp. SE-A7]